MDDLGEERSPSDSEGARPYEQTRPGEKKVLWFSAPPEWMNQCCLRERTDGGGLSGLSVCPGLRVRGGRASASASGEVRVRPFNGLWLWATPAFAFAFVAETQRFCTYAKTRVCN